MAKIYKSTATALRLRVETGTSSSGAGVYASRSVSGVNPDITDADLYDIGQKMAKLQLYPVGAIQRVDTSDLMEEG